MTCHAIRLIPSSAGKYDVDYNGSTIVADSAKPIIVAFESLDSKLKLAGQRPIVDTAEIRSAWRAFEQALRSDAGAKLEVA